MVNGNGIDVRALIATAGMLASVTMGTALAQADAKAETTPGETTASAAQTLDVANDLLANGKVVRAKMMLQPLASEAGSTGLSTSERERVYRLLSLANQKVKAMSPVEVSLQTAEGALASDELALARAQAQAVVEAPKATNEHVGKAKAVLARVEARQAELMPVMSTMLDGAALDLQAGQIASAKAKLERVSRSGVALASADAERLAELQARVMDAPVAAGMMQPGVVKPREEQPTEPATTPAPAPAPSVDAIEMARKAEAQSLFVEADQAFELRRMNDAASKYQRLKGEYFTYLSPEQQKMVNDRLAEARVVSGSAPATATSALQDISATRERAKQLIVTEFESSMQQANSALATGDTERARSAAAAALLKLNSGRDLFSAAEFETRLSQQKDLATRIAQEEEKIRQQAASKQAIDQAERAKLAAKSAQEEKERKISEAVGRVRALQAEMKYKEALQVVDQILFLDPINPTGLLMRDLLQDAEFYRNFGDIQRRKTVGIAKEAVENQDAMIPPSGIVAYPMDWPAKSYQRGGPTTLAESEDNRRALATLTQKRVPVNFEDNRLEDVLKFVQTVTNLNMDVDWPSLEAANIDKETQVSLKLTNVPVRTVLDRVMEKLSPDATTGAGWTVNDGVLTVASKEALNKNTLPLIYDIRDLLIEVPDYTAAPEFDLQSVLQNSGQGGGGGGQSPFRDNQQQNAANRRTLQERTEDLIRIITSNIDSPSWLENGGEVGKIQQFQGNLIITQTPNNHRAVVGLLSKLREQRAMQINVETRFLLVSQDFFEQIGVDFDVYFNGRSNQVRTARQQSPNNSIQPSDFFDFSRGGLQRRVFGAPIDANGDGTADPVVGNPVALPSPLSVIGAGQNSLGLTEGLTQGTFANTILSRAPALGVAGQFLDDIQVDFLVKATQANRRSVSLTAPRLTFTNGQTSNIYVATQVSFVSDLTPVVSESAVGFDPQLDVINEGVRLLVDGTISADRRYVTLNVDASVARIERFENRAITAVAGGQLVNSASTQSFIQLPTTTVTRVQTTVTVPDQGTILLGGQRVVTEGEVETGVPVLSKIPIINRLFSNRTETKEEQTLLILIKPTILIQNEEETKNFPGLDESLRSPFGG
jgi:type II secretory pathway component GspD/PulD (secretin)